MIAGKRPHLSPLDADAAFLGRVQAALDQAGVGHERDAVRLCLRKPRVGGDDSQRGMAEPDRLVHRQDGPHRVDELARGGVARPGEDPAALVVADVDQEALADGLARLVTAPRCLHMELSHPWLRPDALVARGFRAYDSVTHMVPIPSREEAAWQALRGTARNRIKKALDAGLSVQVAADPGIVDHYFEQLQEVFGRQGMSVPYPRTRVESLVRTLGPAGRLLPLLVKQGSTVLAAGLFPYDERCVYFWGGASWLRYRHQCPNDLLHWEVIRFAVARAIPEYNMCGGESRFKEKFGGADVPYVTYSRSAVPGLQTARNLWRWWHLKRRRLPVGVPSP